MIKTFLDGVRDRSEIALRKRFWKKVEKSDHCWLWKGFVNPQGYGHFRVGKNVAIASKISWELTHGPVPKGLLVMHTVCDNPPCVNPDHLKLGTHLENMVERTEKGRTSRWKAFRTHCPKGHEFSPENTAIDRGSRRCLACHRDRENNRRKNLTHRPA